MGVDPPLPSTGEESLFDGRFGADAKVSPHQVKKNGVDAQLPEKVRVAVEQLTVLDRSVCEREKKRERECTSHKAS